MTESPDITASLRGRSERLREFIEAAPLERTSIYRFLAEQASLLPVGSDVIDIGAGEAPYRELFSDQHYVTLDRAETPHSGGVDLHGTADSIPAEDSSFDVVVCTQVLEHVPEPLQALREFQRVLRTGGALIVTVPFLWEEHETPFDYYRYTRYGIEYLLRQAGFEEIDVKPRTDCFTTTAQLLRNVSWAMGSRPDGMDSVRQQARTVLQEMADVIATLAPLDVDMIMPLGFAVRATAGHRSTS
jgi:ubiquinone/menaquinone biosynthesis C-methylase UbiE